MWIPFECNNVCYIGELEIKDSMVYMHVSNFKKIWIQEQNIENFTNDFKTQNPLIASDVDVVIVKLMQLLGGHKCNVNVSNENMTLEIADELEEGYKFTYKFILIEGSTDTFFSKVTASLLNVIHELQIQRDSLCDNLEAKDKEIKQHVFEKGDIKRVDLKTEKLDLKQINQDNDNMSLLKVLRQSTNFTKALFTSLGIQNLSKLKVRSETVKPMKPLKRCKTNKYAKVSRK